MLPRNMRREFITEEELMTHFPDRRPEVILLAECKM